jgi:surface carbohydrate biosynthesis protein (TIGR04326 family)
MIPDDNISYFDKYLLSNRINNQKKSKNYYISLYNLLDINIIIKSFILYTKHFFKVKGLFSNNFISNTNNPYLIFLKKKIFEDIAGKSLAINILHFLLIDKILKNINKPKKLIFLQENQSWEKILLYLFKTKFNTKTIGFAHSSIRFWDLRYFNSLEDIKKKNYILKKITPNITVVNSKLQKKRASKKFYFQN